MTSVTKTTTASRATAAKGKKSAALAHGDGAPARRRKPAPQPTRPQAAKSLRQKATAPAPVSDSPVLGSGREVEQLRLLRFLGFRLTRAKVQVHKQLLQQLDPLQLGATEYSVLVLVDANKGIYQRQLGSALEISPPNMVPIVERLVGRGLLRRVASEQDRRMQELYLTPAGQSLLAQAEASVEDFEATLEARLTATERRYFTSALKKLGAWPQEG